MVVLGVKSSTLKQHKGHVNIQMVAGSLTSMGKNANQWLDLYIPPDYYSNHQLIKEFVETCDFMYNAGNI